MSLIRSSFRPVARPRFFPARIARKRQHTGIRERRGHYIANRVREHEPQLLADVLREIVEVTFVLLRQDHGREPGPARREHLVADAAHGEHLARQRDLPRHRDVLGDRPAGHERDQGSRHRDAGRGTVLGDGAGGNVNVHVPLLERVCVAETERAPVATDPRERRLG